MGDRHIGRVRRMLEVLDRHLGLGTPGIHVPGNGDRP
jgi:hypothetical protein